MGTWRISRKKAGAGLSVVYVNRFTRAEIPCGESAPEQSAQSVIEWACSQADAGDVIVHGHQIFCRLPEAHDRPVRRPLP